MAHCLDNYIGLRGCGSTTPPSGLYVNDLPGMSLENLVTLTNTDEPTYSDIWNMVQTRAQQRFSLDVRQEMGKHYKLNTLMQGINVGNDVGNLAASVPAYAGFTIELIDQNYEFVPSPFASIHVQQIKFYCDDFVNGVPFAIWDLDATTYTGGQVKWSTTVDIIEGENVIEVNQTFHNLYISPSWRLAVIVDTQSLTGLMYNMNLPYNRSMISCCDVRVQGISNDGAGNSFGNNTYGVSGIFSIVCNWDAMICQNKTLFSRAYWFLLGIEVLTEQLYSSKLNQFTTVNLQRLNDLRAEYQVEYNKSLEQAASGLKLSCDCCIECNESVQLREATQFY